jgi:hypothetical protein
VAATLARIALGLAVSLAVSVPAARVEAHEPDAASKFVTALLPHHGEDAICTSGAHGAVASPRPEIREAALGEPPALPEHVHDPGSPGGDLDVARWCRSHSTTSSIH